MARALIHVRRIWPRIFPRINVNDLIPPSLSDGGFSSELKSALADVGFRYGNRFQTHCFRTWGLRIS